MTDPRLTPARGDVAAAHLKGLVQATRYAEGVAHQVRVGVSALRELPTPTSRLETQLLMGEVFTVYDRAPDSAGGWAWGQCARDGYVGYLEAGDLQSPPRAPTHRVSVLRTLVFPAPDIKSAPPYFLSMNAKLCIESTDGRFAKIAGGGYAIAEHLTPTETIAADWITAAELFLHTPYLWGGKDSFGLDCSGLVQTALETVGIVAPRDSDLQEAALGVRLDRAPDDLSGLRRGDLVFWLGHVGIMRDGAQLLHASGHHMMVVVEELADAVRRIAPTDGAMTAVKRI